MPIEKGMILFLEARSLVRSNGDVDVLLYYLSEHSPWASGLEKLFVFFNLKLFVLRNNMS